MDTDSAIKLTQPTARTASRYSYKTVSSRKHRKQFLKTNFAQNCFIAVFLRSYTGLRGSHRQRKQFKRQSQMK